MNSTSSISSTFTDVTISVDIHAVNDLVAGALVIEGGGRIWGLQWYVICVRLLGRFVSAVARGLSQWFRWDWSMKAAGGGEGGSDPPWDFRDEFPGSCKSVDFLWRGTPKNQRLVKAVSFWWRSHILHWTPLNVQIQLRAWASFWLWIGTRYTLTVPGDRPGRCLLAGVVHSLALTGNTIEYKNTLYRSWYIM